MILTIKLNNDTTIHDIKKIHENMKELYEIECSLSDSYDTMRLIVNTGVSITNIQKTVGTCGELYVDTDAFDNAMKKVFDFDPSMFKGTFGIDMANGNSIFSEMIKDLNTKGINK